MTPWFMAPLACALVLALGGTATAQSVIQFSNFAPPVNAPFFAADQTNRLAGSNYVARLYVATAGTADFAPIGPFQPFGTGTGAGFWIPALVPMPFPPGTRLRVQVRVWDRGPQQFGDFQAAEAAGADIALAVILELVLRDAPFVTPLAGLQPASVIPTLTLTRGAPKVASDTALIATASQLENLCGVPVGINRWFRISSPSPAIAVLNTDGSVIDTVMSVFTGSIANVAGLTERACNDDRRPGLTSSAVAFPIPPDMLHLVCVAGKQGADGPVRLTYAAGVQLELERIPSGDDGAERFEVSWPRDAGPFQLEMSEWPEDPLAWQPIRDAPAVVDGRFRVPVSTAPGQACFRLRAIE